MSVAKSAAGSSAGSIATALTAGLVSSGYTYAGVIADAVARWKCDENAASTTVADSVGSKNCTCSVNTDTVDATGPNATLTGAFIFTGAQWITAPTSVGALVASNFTFSCWYKFEASATGNDGAFHIGNNYGSNHGIYMWPSGGPAGNVNWTIRGTVAKTVTVAAPSSDWHRLTGVLDRTNSLTKIYIDSTKTESSTVATNLPTLTGLGGFLGACGNLGNADGTIADFLIWDRVLEDDEIAALV